MTLKTKIRSETKTYLEIRESIISNQSKAAKKVSLGKLDTGKPLTDLQSLRRSMVRIVNLIPTNEKKITILENLHNMR